MPPVVARAEDDNLSDPAERVHERDARRCCSKLIRYSAAELARVNDRARASGRPVACYIREVSLGGRTKAPHAMLNDGAIRGLARVGAQLRALAKTANDRGLAEASDFETALGDLLALIKQID